MLGCQRDGRAARWRQFRGPGCTQQNHTSRVPTRVRVVRLGVRALARRAWLGAAIWPSAHADEVQNREIVGDARDVGGQLSGELIGTIDGRAVLVGQRWYRSNAPAQT